eukprot:3195553-Rhodomonas_salina.5
MRVWHAGVGGAVLTAGVAARGAGTGSGKTGPASLPPLTPHPSSLSSIPSTVCRLPSSVNGSSVYGLRSTVYGLRSTVYGL